MTANGGLIGTEEMPFGEAEARGPFWDWNSVGRRKLKKVRRRSEMGAQSNIANQR
jgi:hypothetical protein